MKEQLRGNKFGRVIRGVARVPRYSVQVAKEAWQDLGPRKKDSLDMAVEKILKKQNSS